MSRKKKYLNIRLKSEQREIVEKLKKKLNIHHDTEVLNRAILLTESLSQLDTSSSCATSSPSATSQGGKTKVFILKIRAPLKEKLDCWAKKHSLSGYSKLMRKIIESARDKELTFDNLKNFKEAKNKETYEINFRLKPFHVEILEELKRKWNCSSIAEVLRYAIQLVDDISFQKKAPSSTFRFGVEKEVETKLEALRGNLDYSKAMRAILEQFYDALNVEKDNEQTV